MAAKTERAGRKFKHGAMVLDDPDTSMSTEQVLEYFALTYPDLNNAVVGDPQVDDEGVAHYEFSVTVGKKG